MRRKRRETAAGTPFPPRVFRSGWGVLLGIIPLVGFIVLLVFTVTEGQAGANEYGPDPKHVG